MKHADKPSFGGGGPEPEGGPVKKSPSPPSPPGDFLRVGVGGPVGSGKTALIYRLCLLLRDDYDLAVVTNDIYTREDAEFLTKNGALPPDRIMGVETGGCPHSAIREDASLNMLAVDEMGARHPGLELVFLESGGDNLSATFSPDLVDLSIYVIDVAGGDKIPRKGGPAVSRSDILVVNKTDLAPHVGADLEVMRRDAAIRRGGLPVVFTDLREGEGGPALVELAGRLVSMGFLEPRGPLAESGKPGPAVRGPGAGTARRAV